jgi:DNA-binding response OmpR family regulator
MKILIIEDEKVLALLMKKGLEESSFTVDVSHDGEEGMHLAETYPYDAVLLDLMLPHIDGLDILQFLRTRNIDVPVLIITARGEVGERIKGLEIGADDYIAKPFEFGELLARLRSVIRRSKGASSPMVRVDDLAIDTCARTVARAGRDITLSAREFDLLEYLALHCGKVISRTELIDHIYPTDSEWDSNVIDVFVNHLRNKIDKGFSRPLIHTKRGAGYMLKGE